MTAQRIFTAAPAVREQVPLLIGLVSPSGGGKTFSALRLATGIQRAMTERGKGGPIVMLDTESRRGLHYADQFQFLHVPFAPPFGAEDYLAALRFAADQKPSCIIIDSLTHEHVGVGGYTDVHDAYVARVAGDDPYKQDRASMAGWAKAGPPRTRLIEGVKQLGGNLICCWRGKEKTKPIKTGGKTEIVPMGLMAIGGEQWIYEMTINILLPPRSDGVPDWTGTDPGEKLQMKLPVQFRDLFRTGTVLSEDLGQRMASWALGGAPRQQAAQTAPVPDNAPPPSPLEPVPPSEMTIDRRGEVHDALTKAAHLGRSPFVKTWNSARQEWQRMPATKKYFNDLQPMWLAMADEADEQAQTFHDEGADPNEGVR